MKINIVHTNVLTPKYEFKILLIESNIRVLIGYDIGCKHSFFPHQTLFVVGILFSRCPCARPGVRMCVRPCVRP